jgi:hypothetical protein
VITASLGFFFGLLIGLLVQREKFRDDLKRDKIRRVIPYIEVFQPIFESLVINIKHSQKLIEQNDSTELARYLDRVHSDFESFGSWFADFIGKGLKPQLESLNYNLLLGLNGTNVHFQSVKNHGTRYILENIAEIGQSLGKTERLLNEFLKS